MSDCWYKELSSADRISQGDIFYPSIHIYSPSPSIVTEVDPEPDVDHFEAPVIILTQACDLENEPVAESVVVSVLRPIDDLRLSDVTNIMAGRRPTDDVIITWSAGLIVFEPTNVVGGMRRTVLARPEAATTGCISHFSTRPRPRERL